MTLGGGMIMTSRGCRGNGYAEAALAWPWLVVAGCGGERPAPVDAIDLTRPHGPPVRLAGAGSDVQVAGRLAGWYEQGAIVVRDLFTRAELTRIAGSPMHTAGGLWDLQPDGKVAVAGA